MSLPRVLSRRVVWIAGLLVPVLSAGCAAPGPVLHDDVVTIYHFYRLEPWVKDEEGRIAGLEARVYFVPAGERKGAFVSGTIKATLCIRTPRPDGTYERTLVHEWTFDEAQAEGFRIVEPSRMGESYGFILRWPGEVNVAGRETEIRFSYVRKDGRVIIGRATPLMVPGFFARQPATRPAGPAIVPATRDAWRTAPSTQPAVKPGGP